MSEQSSVDHDANTKNLSRESAELDLGALPLDALRRFAEHGRDAATRSAARRAIEVRTGAGAELAISYRVAVGKSEYGTQRPEVWVTVAGAREREVRAAALELAADIERALVPTREAWAVSVAGTSSGVAVQVDLWDGSAAEVRRAVALLEQVTGASMRRPGRRPKVVSAAVEAVPDGVTSEASAPVVAPVRPVMDDAVEGRRLRRRREKYRELAGDAADSFEAAKMAGAPDGLPVHARRAAEGGPKSAEYWEWLIDQWRAAQPAEPNADTRA